MSTNSNILITGGAQVLLVTGLSDHTVDNTTAMTSVTLDASIIEKHVTLDRSGDGSDDSFSLEPQELKQLYVGVKTAWESLGQVDYDLKPSEKSNIKFRRLLYFVKDIKEGEVITTGRVKTIRPSYGLAPKYVQTIIDKKVMHPVQRGMPVTFEMIEQ